MRKYHLFTIILLHVLFDALGINSINTGYTIQKVRTAISDTGTYVVASSYEGIVMGIGYDGTILWKNELSGYMNHDLWCEDITGDMIDEILVANADGAVYCLNTAGKKIWTFKPNNGGHLPPMYAVCVIHESNGTPYVVCGGFDMSIYYLSAAGAMVKEIKSSTYSVEKPWGNNVPPDNLHTANFIRKIPQPDGSEVLAVLASCSHMQAKGSIYLFNAMANSPFSITKVSAPDNIGEFRVCDPDGDGTYEVLLGTSALTSQGMVKFEPTSEKMHQYLLTQIGPNGYRVTQAETIQGGSSFKYFMICGTTIVLGTPSGDTNVVSSVEKLTCKYAFNDMWKDPVRQRIILASSQSGGSCIYFFDPEDASWKTDYTNLEPPGKIAAILANTASVQTNLSTFTPPAWERDPLPVYLTWADRSHPVAQNIITNYNSPIFLDGGNEDKEIWETVHNAIANAVYSKKRDNRQNYILTQQQVLDAFIPRYASTPGIAYWGGHGNDPYFYSLSTTKKVLDGAAGKKTVLIFPEMNGSSSDFEFVVEDLIYPIAAHAQSRNGNIFVRNKNIFWQGAVHLPAWARLVSGEFAEVFASGMEETTDKTMDLSLAGRMGIWASGAMDNWGMRCSRDNPSFDRQRQYSYQRLPNHFLRTMIYSMAYGATYLNVTYVDADYMSLAWELVAKGALYVPKRSEIVSFSPVHVSMTTPDEHYLNDGENNKWTTFYDRTFEENNPFVFSRMNGTWPAAPVNEWDFSRYAAGTKDRRQNFLPSYANGMVLITPPQEGVFADENAPRGAMTDHMHPMYEDIMIEYYTDGRHYYSADGTQQYAADEYYKTIEADIKSSAKLLPLTVSGDVGWVVAQTCPTHYRLALIDGGYINPDDRTATVSFHTIEPLNMVGLLDGKQFDISDPSSVTVDVPCGLFRFIDILTDGSVGIITEYSDNQGNNNEDNFVIHEETIKPNTQNSVKPDKSESLPEIEDENISSTEEKPFRSVYIINTTNTSSSREDITFVDSFNMSSIKMIEENSETGSTEAEPVQYAYVDPEPSETGPVEQPNIKQSVNKGPAREEPMVLSETNVLDESLLDASVSIKNPSVNLNKKEKVQKKPPAVLPESKKRRRTPVIGVIVATLLASFGAMVIIKDQ